MIYRVIRPGILPVGALIDDDGVHDPMIGFRSRDLTPEMLRAWKRDGLIVADRSPDDAAWWPRGDHGSSGSS